MLHVPSVRALPVSKLPTTRDEPNVRLPPKKIESSCVGKFAADIVPVKNWEAREPTNAPAVTEPVTARLPATVAPPVTLEYEV